MNSYCEQLWLRTCRNKADEHWKNTENVLFCSLFEKNDYNSKQKVANRCALLKKMISFVLSFF